MPGTPPAAGWAPLTWQQRLLALLGALAVAVLNDCVLAENTVLRALY